MKVDADVRSVVWWPWVLIIAEILYLRTDTLLAFCLLGSFFITNSRLHISKYAL